jgi:GTPase SAR1 family protein
MHFCGKIPIILVGCKKDLRNDPNVIEKLNRDNMQPVTSAAVSMHVYLILIDGIHPVFIRPSKSPRA